MRNVLVLLLLLCPVFVWGQTAQLKGLITDSKGAPISGASVRDGQTYTLTNEEGEFNLTLEVNKPYKFTIRSLGFKSDTSLRVVLKADETPFVAIVLKPDAHPDNHHEAGRMH